ncbi:hypothetical protein F5879DRAFT_995403 [Lentinula edodes]|nr:hypothetical protein F5879DRAFT_995403 [Lentinula edodes]
MTNSRTTKTTTTVGSISITGGTNNPPMTPTRPSMPCPSDEERELEVQLKQTREKNRRLREQKKAEEEAARCAAAEERQQQDEATTSTRRVEVEVPRLVKKGKALPRNEVSRGDPDDSKDGKDSDEDDEEKEPCEQCQAKRIPCLQQAGKRSSIISTNSEGGGLQRQMAQLLADSQILREGQIRANTYDCHMMKKLEWLMRDAARRREGSPEEPIAGPLVLPKKRRRLVDSEE